jgi:hypothetical protein
MFVPIQQQALVPGTKYKMGCLKGIYIDKWINPEGELILKFFEVRKNDIRRFRFISPDSEFYQFVSQQPQWKMERRAVNILVRRLIGDEHFEW